MEQVPTFDKLPRETQTPPEFKLQILVDQDKKLVVVDFGMDVRWLAFTRDQVVDLATVLLTKANELKSKIVIPRSSIEPIK